MATEYKIPLTFKSGKYGLSELSSDSTEALTLSLGDFDVLSYHTPEQGIEVQLYSTAGFMMTEQVIKDGLSAVYDDDGQLNYVVLAQGDAVRLVFISYRDDAAAKREVLGFAEKNADMISEQLLRRKEKAARLFIEYYKDTEGFDFAVKFATAADKQAVIDSYGEDAADGSGNYPSGNRIECDKKTFQIMLLCAPCELMDMAIATMIEGIKMRVIDKLDKTDDFRFIVEDYD